MSSYGQSSFLVSTGSKLTPILRADSFSDSQSQSQYPPYTSASHESQSDDTYVEENSLDEVEAALDFATPESSFRRPEQHTPHAPHRLSRITEATQEASSRRGTPTHSRIGTESFYPPSASPVRQPGRRVGDLAAFFEDRSGMGDSRTGASSPFSQARSLPTIPSTAPRSETPYMSSRPSSPSKSSAFSTMMSPSRHTYGTTSGALPSIPGESTYARSTGSSAYSRPGSPTKASTMSSMLSPPRAGSPTTQFTRRSGVAPSSASLSSVRNIIAAWKERTPAVGKTSKGSATSTDGFFSIRRRAKEREIASSSAGPSRFDELGARPPPVPVKNGRDSDSRSTRSTNNQSIDLAELGPYARRSQEVSVRSTRSASIVS
jgi:hypothetical protein